VRVSGLEAELLGESANAHASIHPAILPLHGRLERMQSNGTPSRRRTALLAMLESAGRQLVSGYAAPVRLLRVFGRQICASLR
jgi:hypothetical protein